MLSKLLRFGVKTGAKVAVLAGTGWAISEAVKNVGELREVGKEEWLVRKERELRALWEGRGINWGLGHCGVTVTDFEKSVQWYNRVFGMKLMNYLEITGDDLKPVERLYHTEGLRLVRLGFMASRSGNVLEVFEFDPPLPGSDKPNPFEFDPELPGAYREDWNRPGYTHIAFNVTNVPGWVSRLKREGVEFMNEPVHSSGADWAFFRDPDGNLIEIIDLHASRIALGRLGCVIGEIFKHTTFANFYK
ncbi:MAG: VOC family protein [Mobiluncus sp.]|uniref:VOC family protein n=1 Tax=Mobiluncus porci TaxID=2652278 RepID=A0A7K0K3X5_9ACTO|nr:MULTISPECIES: VOC family protein [Mobiluncus]MCI6584545.1 VOC family protein [Mobiluncus sp.]MST50187.1 VOC family protein [Mobiluncus porci]